MSDPSTHYAIVNDADGVIVNVVVWDGVSPWAPPEGTTLVPIPPKDDPAIAEPGGIYDAKTATWTRAPVKPSTPQRAPIDVLIDKVNELAAATGTIEPVDPDAVKGLTKEEAAALAATFQDPAPPG